MYRASLAKYLTPVRAIPGTWKYVFRAEEIFLSKVLQNTHFLLISTLKIFIFTNIKEKTL